MTLANTLHPHKLSRITTWHAPNVLVHNQIDYILTPPRFKLSINKAKTRTYPGADVDSDHDLVLMVMKLKLNKLFHVHVCVCAYHDSVFACLSVAGRRKGGA